MQPQTHSMSVSWQRPRPGASMVDMALSKEEFGRRFRAARERASLTQEEVADQLGVKWRQIQRYDTGQVLPNPGRIPKLAEILGVEPAYLQEPVDEHVIDRTARLVQENAVALRTALALLDETLREVRNNRDIMRGLAGQIVGRVEALEARMDAGEFSDAQREVLRLAGVPIPPPATTAPGSTSKSAPTRTQDNSS